MKKKLLTVALAATMVAGSTMSAIAATADADITGGLGSANTGDEALKGDFDVTYTFKNESYNAGFNWYNFAVEVMGEGFGITARADAFAVGFGGAETVLGGWGDNPIAPTTKWEGLPADWAVWAAGMASADVEVNVKRADNALTITYDITGKDGKEYTMIGKTPKVDTMPEDLKIHITGEKVKLSNVTFTDNNKITEEVPTPQPSPDGDNNDNEPITKPSPDADKNENESVKPSPDADKNENESVKPSPDTDKNENESVKPAPGGSAADKDTVVSEDGKVSLGTVGDFKLPAGTKLESTALTSGDLFEAAKNLVVNKFGADRKFAAFEINLMNGTTALTQLDGKVIVTMDAPFAPAEGYTIVVYRVDGENLVKCDTELKDGKVSFTTDHFSTYVFVEEKVEAEDGGKTPTGDMTNVAMILGVAALAGVAVVLGKKKVEA